MKQTRFTILLVIVALLALVVGCSSDQGVSDEVLGSDVRAQEMGLASLSRDVFPLTGLSDHDATQGVVVRDVEVLLDARWTDERLRENLFPTTFHANQGDVVRLVFLLGTPKSVYIEGLGVYERVSHEVIEFVAQRKGVFSIVCLDCENTNPSDLIVS